jgi:hypothetical protein
VLPNLGFHNGIKLKKMIKVFKISLTALLLLGSSILFFNSCSKRNNTNIETVSTSNSEILNSVKVSKHGYLIFNSEESYNKCLDKFGNMSTAELDMWEKSISYVSLRTNRIKTANKPTRSVDYNTLFNDELFETIIDENGLVQIGNTIFKSETDYNYVWTLQASHLEDYSDLIGREFVPSTMNIFKLSNEDTRTIEIWESLENGLVGVDETGGTYSSLVWTPFGDDSKPPATTICEEQGSMCVQGDVKAVYQAALFYFSLQTKCKTYRKPSGNTLWLPLTTDICLVNTASQQSFAKWQSKKSSWSQSSYIYNNACTNDNVQNWRPNSRSRGLNSYELKGSFKFFAPFTIQTWVDHTAYLLKH